jgi:predicted NBD/HSP70 family sugar kinase
MQTTGDQRLLKRINRSVLLRLTQQHGSLSRARMATHSGLTKSTVSALVRELLDEQWLIETGSPVSLDGLGRPSTPLRLNAAGRVLIGIEVAVECLRMVCISLTGEVLFKQEVPLQSPEPPAVCTQVAKLLQPFCADLASRQIIICGVGLCLPGTFHDDTGLVHFAPNLGWRNVDFLGMVNAAFAQAGIACGSVLAQNDADAAALGEYEFGGGTKDDPLIFISCDVGVGAGIVLNDSLFTGARGAAGEIGHTILQIDGPLCSCGRYGCAETFIGARALKNKSDIDRAGQFLGVLIQNLNVLFNPRAVVLGGKICADHPQLLVRARDTAAQYARQSGMPMADIRDTRYGLQAPAVGAAAMVLHRFLRPLSQGVSHVFGN